MLLPTATLVDSSAGLRLESVGAVVSVGAAAAVAETVELIRRRFVPRADSAAAELSGELAKFDFTWFIPAVVKYRRLLAEILLI